MDSINGLDIKAIKPTLHEKYSLNLYNWLTKRGRTDRAKRSKVYRDKQGALWIGYFYSDEPNTWFSGAKLIQVLSQGNRSMSGAWIDVNPQKLKELKNFWRDYTRIGRCAIDKKHLMWFRQSSNRWHVEGENRTCNWCNKGKQHIHRWTETVEHEGWVND